MTNLETLCAQLLEAKRAEDRAKRERIALEAQIAAAVDVPEEGSKTHRLDAFKVTVTQPVTRKLDEEEWNNVAYHIPSSLHPVKATYVADPAGCKWLFNNEPEMWAKIASAFETKPGKIAVKVEAI